ncbi:MAG: hypothetical protein FJ026_07760 [Chloroflexi bacterium]|nr:hypothetical protein [Chloroflexota bacterium]
MSGAAVRRDGLTKFNSLWPARSPARGLSGQASWRCITFGVCRCYPECNAVVHGVRWLYNLPSIRM